MSAYAMPRFDPGDFSGDITLDHVISAAEPIFAALPSDLRPELVAALGRRGIERLYSHQAEAYNAVRSGRHLVVVTPTASGKTLCYNLPVLQRLLESPEKRALYIYPTSTAHCRLPMSMPSSRALVLTTPVISPLRRPDSISRR